MNPDILGNLSQFIPKKNLAQVAKSTKYARDFLLGGNIDIDSPSVCESFTKEDFEILIKRNLDRQKLFKCVVDQGLNKYVKIMLNEKRKEYQINPGINMNLAIRTAAELGYYEIVELLLEDPRVNPSDYENNAINLAIAYGHHNIVNIMLKSNRLDPKVGYNLLAKLASSNATPVQIKLALKRGIDPGYNNSEAFIRAALNGNIEVMKVLLETGKVDPQPAFFPTLMNHKVNTLNFLLDNNLVDSTVNNSIALYDALDFFDEKILEILLKDGRLDPRIGNNRLFMLASKSSFSSREKVIALLKDGRADPSYLNNYLINWAAKKGYSDIVKLLLKDNRVDPTAKNNRAIKSANNKDIIKLLSPHPKIKHPQTPDLKILKYIIHSMN